MPRRKIPAPSRIDETTFRPAEACFAPRVVRSGSIGGRPERQQELNDGVAAIKHHRARNHVGAVIETALPAEPAAADDENAASDLARDIWDAQRVWLKSCAWAERLDDETRERVLTMIELQMRGQLASSTFAASMRELKASVTGTTAQPADYYRGYRNIDTTRLPGGW